jgi:O-antigen ligase
MAGVVCGFACYMTLSRGAFAATACGLGVILLMRPRRSTAIAAAGVFGPVLLLALATLTLPAVREAPHKGAADQISQGRVMVGLVLLVAILAAVIVTQFDVDDDRRLIEPARAMRAALALTVAMLVAVVAVSYVSEQTEEIAGTSERLGEAKTFRAPYWRVALGAFADHPLNGIGSGSFRVEWRKHTEQPRAADDAHSIYFETLGELGLVGGLLLGAFIVALVAGTAAAARAAPDDVVLPAAAGVVAAFLVHVGVDWDWELPAVTLPALIMAAAAITRPEPETRS